MESACVQVHRTKAHLRAKDIDFVQLSAVIDVLLNNSRQRDVQIRKPGPTQHDRHAVGCRDAARCCGLHDDGKLHVRRSQLLHDSLAIARMHLCVETAARSPNKHNFCSAGPRSCGHVDAETTDHYAGRGSELTATEDVNTLQPAEQMSQPLPVKDLHTGVRRETNK